MKLVQLLLLTSVIAYTGNAQTNKEPELTREQKWQVEKTETFFKKNKNDVATIAFLKTFKTIVASNTLCEKRYRPTQALRLEGDRLSTETALLSWNVTNENGDETYLIERRYNNPFGSYDSVGLLQGASAKVVFSSYRFVDQNNYNGKTWYRIRMRGSSNASELVCVEGYNNSVKVYPNPALSSAVSVQLNQFRTDDNTSLEVLDAAGKIVYAQSKVFGNNAKVMRLQNLKLKPGTYYVRVANRLNTGGTSFLVH